MASGITISGLKELQARIKAAPGNISKIVSAELRDGANAIAAEAKTRAPGDQGILRNLIGTQAIDAMNYEVISAAEYSAYVEFGTGANVEIPAGLTEYAAQFQGAGPGSGLGLKEAIFAWCERKGIEKDLWYAIFISIVVNGVHAQPFFFPAVARQEPIIIANVKRALEDSI